MSYFFAFLASVSELALLATLVWGYFHATLGYGVDSHMFLGLGSVFLGILTHCLIFAIFTGSGKDAREVTEDLRLSADYIKETRRFRKVTFPPAMYAILLLLLTSLMGGAFGASSFLVLRMIHQLLGWVTALYNAKVFVVEGRAVFQNAKLLKSLNKEAAVLFPAEAAKTKPDEQVPLMALAKDHLQWGQHVHALGRFLCFLGYNVWLPFLYLKYVMGYMYLPFWPFLGGSAFLILGGVYLRTSYHDYRPFAHQN